MLVTLCVLTAPQFTVCESWHGSDEIFELLTAFGVSSIPLCEPSKEGHFMPRDRPARGLIFVPSFTSGFGGDRGQEQSKEMCLC